MFSNAGRSVCRVRLLAAVARSCFAVSILAGPASAVISPPITQLVGNAACVSETGTGGACADFHHLTDTADVTVSPDGRNVYVTSRGDDALLIFDRNPATGQITGKLLGAGCIAAVSVPAVCQEGEALENPAGVVVSPDGRNVYVATSLSSSVSVFDRDSTGGLLQKAGTDGCISETGSAGACVDGKGLDGADDLAVSPDGRNVYVIGSASQSVAVFDRDPATGELTQKAGTAGCISENGSAGACVNGRALGLPVDIAVSPDGTSVYVASSNISDAIAVFDRDLATGALTLKAGTSGCVSEVGAGEGCATATGLDNILSLDLSRDGRNLYAAAHGSQAVTVFDRAATGVLTQKAGTDGCISETGTGGLCVDGDLLVGAQAVTVSADGSSVYVASSSSNALVVFDRDVASGSLVQKTGTAGCVSNTGSGGICVDGVALLVPQSVVVSPDGRNVYSPSAGSAAVTAFSRAPVAYDVDGDGEVDTLTDTMLLMRYSFGFTGATLIDGAVDQDDCTRCTAPDIEAFIAALGG